MYNYRMSSSLTPFFQPKGVVIVGASTSPQKLGYGVARNLVVSGYRGAIHFVSQKSGMLFGRPLYTALSQVPEPVDLAVLIVPAGDTPQALEACEDAASTPSSSWLLASASPGQRERPSKPAAWK